MTLAAFKEDLTVSPCKVGQSINTRERQSNTIDNVLIKNIRNLMLRNHQLKIYTWITNLLMHQQGIVVKCQVQLIYMASVKNVKLEYVLKLLNIMIFVVTNV